MNEFQQVQDYLEEYEVPEDWKTAKEMLHFVPEKFLFSAFGKISSFSWLKKNTDQWRRIEYDTNKHGEAVRITFYSPTAQRQILDMLKRNGPLCYTAAGGWDTYDLP